RRRTNRLNELAAPAAVGAVPSKQVELLVRPARIAGKLLERAGAGRQELELFLAAVEAVGLHAKHLVGQAHGLLAKLAGGFVLAALFCLIGLFGYFLVLGKRLR